MWRKRGTVFAGLTLILLPLTFQYARNLAAAAPTSSGSLDGSFGSGGKVTTDFAGGYDAALSVALQSDGKIVTAGYAQMPSTGYDFALARYNPDGTLDTSFGGTGKVTTDFGSPADYGYAMAIQPWDGKIVVAGITCVNFDYSTYTCYDSAFALARYNTDGSLDLTFGSSGKVITNLVTTYLARETEVARAAALQSDGRILVAGDVWNGSDLDFALVRYNSNGTLDTTFGHGGVVTTDFAGGTDVVTSLAVQPSDGKIIAAGGSYHANATDWDFALARYNTDGSLDTSFGNLGTVTTDFYGSTDLARSVVLQTDGKIVTGGYAYTSCCYSSAAFALARYNTDGSLDTSFGSGGKVSTDFRKDEDAASAGGLALQSNGEIVAVGYATIPANGGTTEFALARYNTNGTLDTSFGSSGKVITSVGTGNASAAKVAIQPLDGKIVAAGYATTSTNTDFAVARYLP